MSEEQLTPTSPRRNNRPKSNSFIFLSLAITLLVGFVAGTRYEEIIAATGSVFGIKVDTSSLDLATVESTYRQLKANYDGELNEQALIDGASRGLVQAAGDDYTAFLDANEAAEFDKDISGQIGGGIGVELGKRNDQPTVVRLLAGNPAETAGVQAGDTITKVNDESSFGWTTAKVAEKVRGEVGTTVRLTVLRGEESKEFTITRAEVKNPSVQASVDNNIGILTITRFDDSTAQLARAAAQDFKAKNVQGVVLDLRGNGGGYLTAGQEVAGIWLNDKIVVSERANGRVTDELKSGKSPILEGVKTVVLVNESSASASEIVAGALKDHGAATLVGAKTFGKGTVQKVLDLGAGTKLKVTIARWYTPSGKNITKDGITPDQEVELKPEDVNAGKDLQLEAAKTRVQQ